MMIPAYRTLPEMPTVLSGLQMFGKLSGLGCDCSDMDPTFGCLDPEPCSTIPTTPIDVTNLPTTAVGLNPIFEATGTLQLPTPAPSSPSTGAPASPATSAASAAQTTAEINLGAQLAKSGFSLAQEVAAQPGMVIGPNGLSYQNPGYPVGTTASLTTPSSSTMIMLAVLAIGAVAVIGMRH
jgi:hypothetical protein